MSFRLTISKVLATPNRAFLTSSGIEKQKLDYILFTDIFKNNKFVKNSLNNHTYDYYHQDAQQILFMIMLTSAY